MEYDSQQYLALTDTTLYGQQLPNSAVNGVCTCKPGSACSHHSSGCTAMSDLQLPSVPLPCFLVMDMENRYLKKLHGYYLNTFTVSQKLCPEIQLKKSKAAPVFLTQLQIFSYPSQAWPNDKYSSLCLCTPFHWGHKGSRVKLAGAPNMTLPHQVLESSLNLGSLTRRNNPQLL